jgi:hypothetical protein
VIRGPIAVVLLVAIAAASSCKCKSRDSAQPTAHPERGGGAAESKDAAAKPRIPPATEPDPGYEARRDELLRRGDPEVMKPAPVIDLDQPPAEASATDLIKSVSKDVMMVKDVKVDLAKRRIEIPGKVVLREGMLEFIAVTPAGKTYESFLSVETTAVQLRLALTLLGLEGKEGDVVGVSVALPGGEVPLADLLVDRKTDEKARALQFQVIPFDDKDKAEALRTAQMISLVDHEPFAPLRVVGDVGNPYAGADQGLGLASKKVPEVGTAITLILTAP